MTRVEVTTGSRLHFGLLCGAPESAWHYGGIGLMVDQPSWQISVTSAPTSNSPYEVDASGPVRERIQKLIEQFRCHQPQLPAIRCSVQCEVDFHSGLGSGTQLTLATGAALSILAGRGRPSDLTALATDLGRSRRSAIGTYGFDRGGFVVDYGKREGTAELERHAFPDAWRMVLIKPLQLEGLSGCSEESFFDSTGWLGAAAVHRAAALITEEICPALAFEDFDRFANSLAEYGQVVGSYYAAQQGGIFSSPLIRQLSPWMEQMQLRPVQSSWGPTVCVPAPSEQMAAGIVDRLRDQVSESDAELSIVRGLNSGARIITPAPESYRSFG